MSRYEINLIHIEDDRVGTELLTVRGPRDAVLAAVPMIGQVLGNPLAGVLVEVEPPRTAAALAATEQKARRPRRTREQIAADEAAAKAGPVTRLSTGELEADAATFESASEPTIPGTAPEGVAEPWDPFAKTA